MTLAEYEAKINTLLDEDVNNQEAYELMIKMIKYFLVSKRCCKCDEDYTDIAQLITEDFYLKIVDNNPVKAYLGYLNKSWRRYVSEYYRYEREVIDTTEDNFLSYVKKDLFGEYSVVDFMNTENVIYLEKIQKTIEYVMETSCKYDHDSAVYINLELSLILSLLRGEEVYFHLNKEQEFYLKLLLASLQARIHSDGVDLWIT